MSPQFVRHICRMLGVLCLLASLGLGAAVLARPDSEQIREYDRRLRDRRSFPRGRTRWVISKSESEQFREERDYFGVRSRTPPGDDWKQALSFDSATRHVVVYWNETTREKKVVVDRDQVVVAGMAAPRPLLTYLTIGLCLAGISLNGAAPALSRLVDKRGNRIGGIMTRRFGEAGR